MPCEQEEAHPHREARDHAAGRVFVERGEEKPHDGSDAHEPDGETPEQWKKRFHPVPEEEDRNGSDPRGEGADGSDECDDDDFGHGRPYPV